MATLLQHVRPWMQRVIEESPTRVEQLMEQMMDCKVQAVHQLLDAFELRVLEQPAPSTNVSAFRKELASLRADLDILLARPETKPESAPTTLVDDTVLDALLGDDMPPPSSSHRAGKSPRSSRDSEDTLAERARKRERQQFEEARKAFIVDEETRQQRAREVGVGASSSVSTTDGAVRVVDITTEGVVTVDAGTTEGDPSVDLSGSGKSDPPAC
uniref:Integrase core domain containing protein n=1 Tax=Solanum tuberosum TaxID=4113 RepID=M1E0X8_SOLTU